MLADGLGARAGGEAFTAATCAARSAAGAGLETGVPYRARASPGFLLYCRYS